jgi:hypothetical protein
MSLVLSFDERKRLATLFVLLVNVHKRTAASAQSRRSTKCGGGKKAKSKLKEKGPQIHGPLVFKVIGFLLNKLFIFQKWLYAW